MRAADKSLKGQKAVDKILTMLLEAGALMTASDEVPYVLQQCIFFKKYLEELFFCIQCLFVFERARNDLPIYQLFN